MTEGAWGELRELVAGLPLDVRGRVSEAWAEAAQAEHASIGSFARFTGTPLGPGPLALDPDILGPTDLFTVVRSAVEEGCVGETLAALEADAARERAEPLAVRDVLTTIARDEATHAALAYEFVSWAIATNPTVAIPAVERGFARAVGIGRAEPVLASMRDAALRAHGQLPAAERHAVRCRGLVDVVEPAAAQLLAQRGTIRRRRQRALAGDRVQAQLPSEDVSCARRASGS